MQWVITHNQEKQQIGQTGTTVVFSMPRWLRTRTIQISPRSPLCGIQFIGVRTNLMHVLISINQPSCLLNTRSFIYPSISIAISMNDVFVFCHAFVFAIMHTQTLQTYCSITKLTLLSHNQLLSLSISLEQNSHCITNCLIPRSKGRFLKIGVFLRS